MTEPASWPTRLPDEILANWTNPPGRPEVGQIWRARWEGIALLVLLTRVTRTRISAAAVTSEVELATQAAAVLPAQATTLAIPLAVWDNVTVELPVSVLDRHLGTLSSDMLTQPIAEALNGPNSKRGEAPISRADPSIEEQARLEDALDVLTDATWAPEGTGTLGQLFDHFKISLPQIRSLPGVKPAEALTIRRGQRPVTGPQVDALVELTNTTADTWWAANPTLPADLIEELDQPGARASIVALATRDNRTEIDERRAIAYDVYALAARQTGEHAREDWAGRLNSYLTGRTGPPPC